ncbi:LCP family glycopolymer transferase [Salisediminibacterium beveridgei]|uniref:Polyisoprenyl-teichoic acid--peptidoglycan teichoic acid transferase TagU n=1 Tax=Salisediminibacterium beveridgei TaxID=632773 RepID=A0A1D7QRP6_9BACI|nr:LCP family protein [Salisediminibacterium beveridgei]AOM81675.1 Cell envelope-associated transcriptional attenuator LytR-CpsA-Psr, subfamily F2 [Salisediminibacterium beveridgei]
MTNFRQDKRNKGWKSWGNTRKFFTLTGGIFIILLLIGGGYVYNLYKSVESTVDSNMYEELDRNQSDKRAAPVNLNEKEPVSFLLLGIDAEEGQHGRSDTIIVVTADPNDDSMKMLSIPRDTRTEIIGRGNQDKINHAFAFGGSNMAMDTVENFLDIPIDYVVRVNMDGFTEMVDAVGGVDVENSFSFSQGGYTFPEGEVSLDGDRALEYTRMRSGDPQGDMGRNIRQQQVVNAIISEGASFSSITRVGDILDGLGSNVNTNLDFDSMTKLMNHYHSSRHNSETLEIEGSGTTINGIWYYEVPEEERQRVSNRLKDHLRLNKSDSSTASSD